MDADAGAEDVGDDEFDIGVDPAVILEQIAHEFSQMPRPVKVPAAKGNNNAAAASSSSGPIPERIRNSVFVGQSLRGRISYMLQWQPMAVSALCRTHADCLITTPLGEAVTDEELVQWLATGPEYPNAAAHLAARPTGCWGGRRQQA